MTPSARARKWCPNHPKYLEATCSCQAIMGAVREALEEAEKIARVEADHSDGMVKSALNEPQARRWEHGAVIVRHVADTIAALREGRDD